MADEVWLDILPSMRKFGPELIKGAGKAAKTAGSKAGKDYSGAFEDGADGAGTAAVAELETAQKRASGLVSKLSGDVSRARQSQQRSAAALIDAETKAAAAVEKFGQDSDQARAASLRLEAARGKAADESRKLATSEDALGEAQKGLKATTEQLESAQKGLNAETEGQPKKWGKIGQAIGGVKEKFVDFSGSVGGAITQLAGAVGGAALLTDAFGTALEGETAVDRISAALNATPEQAATYGKATGDLYSAGFGDGMEDVGGAVDAVVSSMDYLQNASAKDIEQISGYALNLADAFDVDVGEAATAAGSMIHNGLAKDGVEAMDLLTGAMQGMPQQVRDEALPALTEYGKHFSQLGIDGTTAVGMLVAASKDGTIGVDKMGDAVKEFGLRATDMSSATGDVYKTIGLDMHDMTNELLAGGDRGEAAMAKIVHGLQGIDDPAKQAEAAIALFGTPLEDLGVDKIPEFLGMMDPMGDSFEDMSGRAEKMGNTLNDNVGTNLEIAKRQFQEMLVEGIKPLLGPLNGFLKWATETPGVLTAVGVGLGVVAVAWAAMTLAASPWLAIGVGVAAAIAGIVLVVMNFGSIIDWFVGLFRAAIDWIIGDWQKLQVDMANIGAAISSWWTGLWSGVTSWFRGVWSGVTSWASNTWSNFVNGLMNIGATVSTWWNNLWSGVSAFFSDAWNNVVSFGKNALIAYYLWLVGVGNNLKNWWNSLWSGIGSFFRSIWTNFTTGAKIIWNSWIAGIRSTTNALSTWWSGLWTRVGNFFKNTWSRFTGGVRALWNSWISFTRSTGNSLSTWWTGLWSRVGNFFKNIWTNFTRGVRTIFSTWVTWLRSTGNNLSSWWSTLWGNIRSRAVNLFTNLTSGIRNVWRNNLKPIFDAIRALLRGDFVKAFDYAKRAGSNAFKGIANLVRKPINFVIGTVYNKGLKKLFNGISSKLGMKWRLPDVGSIPAFAKGGYHKGGWALVGEEGPELVNFSNPGRVYTAEETQDMVGGREQAPFDALGVLTGAKMTDSLVPAGGFWSDVWGGVKSGIGAAKDWVVGKIADGVRALTNPLKKTIKSFLPGAGINSLIRGGITKVIDDMVKWAIGADDKKAAQQAAAGGGSGAIYDGPRGKFHRPSRGPFTSMYGPRWGGFHAGVDIAGGGPTYAAMDGMVSKVGWNAVVGRTGLGIILNHGPGLYTYYGHNPVGGVKVKPGQKVKGGQHIGYQGATGNVTGTHLHFEVHEGGVGRNVNPMKYMKYDNGGILGPGEQLTTNQTGKPEYILTTPQWQTFHALAEHGANQIGHGGDTYVNVTIDVDDLEGIKTLEEFLAMARRKARQRKGANV